MGQRVPVQKQQWRSVTAVAQANLRAGGLDIGERKAGHDFHQLSPIGSTVGGVRDGNPKLNRTGGSAKPQAPAWETVGPSPASRVCLISRALFGSNRRPRCIVERLSHITKSLTRHLCE